MGEQVCDVYIALVTCHPRVRPRAFVIVVDDVSHADWGDAAKGLLSAHQWVCLKPDWLRSGLVLPNRVIPKVPRLLATIF